jgi:hypothetical protein
MLCRLWQQKPFHRARGRRARPAVELLEDRAVPASISVSSARVLVLGDGTPNHVTIRDDGAGKLHIAITGTPGAVTTVRHIHRLVVRTLGGNDMMSYIQAGQRTQNMQLEVALGKGANQFTAYIQGSISAGRDLRLSVAGGPNNDTINVQTSANVTAGGILSAALFGGPGQDKIQFNYQGRIDGTADVTFAGGPGDDTLQATVAVDPQSRGSGTLWLQGGAGDDLLKVLVANTAHSTPIQFGGHVFVDGGEGFDVCVLAPGGSAVNCEAVTWV